MRRRQLPGEPPPPTKGELKRRARSTQDLAERLIEAPPEVVDGLALPEKLADAIALARRITAHGAALRQRQFVAKLMRHLDPGPIETALDADAVAARHEAARFKRAERWRDRLVKDGQTALAEFQSAFPGAAGAELERLVAAAVAERRGSQPPGAGRKLFRFVQDVLATTGQA
jgi:ribosome-associated protein